MLMKLTYGELKDSKTVMMYEEDIRDYRKSM